MLKPADTAVDIRRSYELAYHVRGPEWAVALPQGDLHALAQVMRRCATFWNGAGTLLIPVRRDGRIPSWIDVLLATRPVDRILIHEGLCESARNSVTTRFAHAELFSERYDDRELHTLLIADVESEPPLRVPNFRGREMQLFTLACWGALQDEDVSYWEAGLEVTYVSGADAASALVDGQIGITTTSPLYLSARHMNLVQARNMGDSYTLFVLPSASFSNIVWFWDIRSRSLSVTGRPPVVGVPARLLNARPFQSFLEWLAEPPGSSRTPNLFVAAAPKDLIRFGPL